jgi:hypothetical protein
MVLSAANGKNCSVTEIYSYTVGYKSLKDTHIHTYAIHEHITLRTYIVRKQNCAPTQRIQIII